MSLFLDSTQRRCWMFSRASLAAKRKECRERYDRERAEHNQPKAPVLTQNEQELLLSYYERRILEFASAFSLPLTVVGTAIIFFKRFYLSRTVMDEDPRIIAITSLLLATKSEEAHIRLSDLAKTTGTTTESILEFEQVVLEGLQFQLKAHTPFRSVQGFVNEIEDLPKKQAKEFAAEAESQVLLALYTDAIFLFSPSQIALVCAQRASKTMRLKLFTDWFSQTYAHHECFSKLSDTIQLINNMIDDAASRPQSNTEIYARLKQKRDSCRNLLRDPTSDLSNAAKQRADEQREAKRLKKHMETSKKEELLAAKLNGKDESPFEIRSIGGKRRREDQEPCN